MRGLVRNVYGSVAGGPRVTGQAQRVQQQSRSGHRCLLVLWIALVFLLPGAVGLSAPPKTQVKTTQGHVEALSMDGALVAYDVRRAQKGPQCYRVFRRLDQLRAALS
jgi:hypothetical protein